MESFPFTKKKLRSQPIKRQHKLIAEWLKKRYLSCSFNSFSNTLESFFITQYLQVLDWIYQAKPYSLPQSFQEYIEFYSNHYHIHLQKSGKGIHESNLLPIIQTDSIKKGDKNLTQKWNPCIDYEVVLDNVRSAFNVGSIFRTVDCAGWAKIVCGGMTPDISNRQVKKASMKTFEWIPSKHIKDIISYLKDKKEENIPIIALETFEHGVSYHKFKWPKKAVLVLGNEEFGISKSVLEECTFFISIPMYGYKNSLNVANAFSIIAFSVT